MLRSLREQGELKTKCHLCLSYSLEDDCCEVTGKVVDPDSAGCDEWRENLMMREFDLFNIKV